MRPVDMQLPAMQALNVQQQQQQLVDQAMLNQQAFAAAMDRLSSQRPSQVQEPQASASSGEAKILGEDRGEKPPKRRGSSGGGEADPDEREGSASDAPGRKPGGRVDLIV